MKKSQKVYARGFKGFNPGMVCRGKQYKENTVFTEETAQMCVRGMHFCKNPLDVLGFYPLLNENGEPNEFAKVEALAPVETEKDKSVTTKLKVGRKLSLGEFIRAAVNYLFREKDAVEVASGDFSKLAASGDYSQLATSGACSKLTASGEHSNLAASGDASKLVASGDYSQLAASGIYSKLATSGDYSQLAASGDCSQMAAFGYNSRLAASGKYSNLTASGDFSKLTASGDSSVIASVGSGSRVSASGKNCIVASLGRGGRVKGALGTILICAEWSFNKPVCVKTVKVDGKKIKADTEYAIREGKWAEV